jgi:N-acetyl-beta-hexosaminidase
MAAVKLNVFHWHLAEAGAADRLWTLSEELTGVKF